MGDITKLAKPPLEDLYLGVPDESVDLSFKDLLDLKQNRVAERKISNTNEIPENICSDKNDELVLDKLLRFKISKELEASEDQPNTEGEFFRDHEAFNKSEENKGLKNVVEKSLVRNDELGKLLRLEVSKDLKASKDQHHIKEKFYSDRKASNKSKKNKGLKKIVENSFVCYDISPISSTPRSPYEEGGGRRRAGIPHSNICSVCVTYVYIFRHRCLVCGRVYCRQCVSVGMGEMTEGRKCIDCLGRRFSQRYIPRAGNVGCYPRYPRKVKKQELKWAEMGPRRRGMRRPRSSSIVSATRIPTIAYVSRTPSFVVKSSCTLTHCPFPF